MPADRDTRFDDSNPWDPETGTLRTQVSEALKAVSPFDAQGLPKTKFRAALDKVSPFHRVSGAPKQKAAT
jgi:hypothetical protein